MKHFIIGMVILVSVFTCLLIKMQEEERQLLSNLLGREVTWQEVRLLDHTITINQESK